MNKLARSLGAVCSAHVLDDKWLVAPSLRVGHQWLDAVTRAGQPVVNVRVHTLTGMALELAGSEMAERGLMLVSGQAGAVLVDRVLRRLRKAASGGYLFSLKPSAGLSETIYHSIQAIRLAGLDSGQLDAGRFEVAAKGREIHRILEEYLRELTSHHLIDYAGVLETAIGRLKSGASVLSHVALVLVPADLDCRKREKDVLQAIPTDRLLTLAVDEPLSPGKTAEVHTDADLLRWVNIPGEAPAPRADGTVRFFRATGEVNEVREVLRRALADGVPLDDVEVLHTDAATYLPLIFETAERFRGDEGPLAGGLPVTFAEGIPARYTRPGRALAAWLAWIGDDFLQGTLVRMIQDGLLHIPGMEDQGWSFAGLAAQLRSVGIGFQQNRYLRKLDAQIAAVDEQVGSPRGLKEDDDDGRSAAKAADLKRRRDGLRLLRDLVGGLLSITPEGGARQVDILAAATRFLNTHARRAGELDNLALGRLVEEIEALQRLIPDGETSLDAMECLANLPTAVHVAGSGPRPGCIHVAHLLSGGHSGRGHTFIVGLDDTRFPGAGLQDPVLLDSERRKLSPEVPTAADGLERRIQDFGRLLARLRGQVTLSFSCRDIAEDRELFPSAMLLAAWRAVSARHQGDQSEFLNSLAPPASFAPDRTERCLDDAEWWLWRLCGSESPANREEVVLRQFAHLARGRCAAEARAGAAFTAYDGFVPEAGRDLNPFRSGGAVFSASGLQSVGQCPLRFFFQYVLGLQLPEELAITPDQWLDPLSRGSLLHEVFRRFMADLLAERKMPPVRERDWPHLRAILEDVVREYRDLIPPPSEDVFKRERADLEQAVHIFLVEEEEFCRESEPVYLEASIGMPGGGQPTDLDTPKPVRIGLRGGRSIHVRGRIDRVDRVGGPRSRRFAIWDYKTGGTWQYTQAPPFYQGRVVQHLLYHLIGQERLREVVPGAVVESVGFFFPGRKGQGERLSYAPEALRDGVEVLKNLCQIVANGAFAATTNADADCKFCDYKGICADTAGLAASSQTKVHSPANDVLAPFTELRGDGQKD